MSRMNYRRLEQERRSSRVSEQPLPSAKTTTITAKYDGTCVGCGRRYSRGTRIKPAGLGVKGWRHLKC